MKPLRTFHRLLSLLPDYRIYYHIAFFLSTARSGVPLLSDGAYGDGGGGRGRHWLHGNVGGPDDLAVGEIDAAELLLLAVAADEEADREDLARRRVVLQRHPEQRICLIWVETIGRTGDITYKLWSSLWTAGRWPSATSSCCTWRTLAWWRSARYRIDAARR